MRQPGRGAEWVRSQRGGEASGQRGKEAWWQTYAQTNSIAHCNDRNALIELALGLLLRALCTVEKCRWLRQPVGLAHSRVA